MLKASLRHTLGLVDRLYRRRHGLAPAGPLLFVGHFRYDGPEKQFDDGTRLRRGDRVGTLHFNNARIAAFDGATPAATGLQFRRLLFQSLRALAQLPAQQDAFRDVSVYRGVSWIRHGENIGFLHEPAPRDWRNRLLALHVQLLVRAFAPAGGTAESARPELTISWLTRRALEKRFVGGSQHAA